MDLPPTVLRPSIHVPWIGGGLEKDEKSDIVHSNLRMDEKLFFSNLLADWFVA